MEIILAKNIGFCFGVKRAINIVQNILEEREAYILGPLVHNEKVMEELIAKGLKVARALTQIPKGESLILRAHGTSPDLIREAKRRGLRVIDCTCPFVSDIHKKIRELENQRYFLIIIGDKDHVETKGIRAHVRRALVIESRRDLQSVKKEIRQKKIGIVLQSTQSIENVSEILPPILEGAQEIKIFNTICRPTRERQREVKELAQKAGAMLIVGSKRSANTHRLYKIASSLNPHTYFVSKKEDLPLESLKIYRKIAIASGSSTPPELVEEIVEFIKKNCP